MLGALPKAIENSHTYIRKNYNQCGTGWAAPGQKCGRNVHSTSTANTTLLLKQEHFGVIADILVQTKIGAPGGSCAMMS